MSTQSIDVINAAIGEETAPSMQAPLDGQVDLIRGLWNEQSGTFDTLAEVRELDGSDEEALVSLGSKDEVGYGEYLTAVLWRSVVSIGGKKITDHKVLDTLINADRDLLLLQTMRVTYGNNKSVQAICNSCFKKNDVVIDLDSDFPVTLPEFDINEPIEIKGRKVTYKFTLPTGADTTAASKAKGDAEANTIVISRCASFPEGEEPTDRVAWARKLNISDRHKIIDKLLSIELGPKLGAVDTHCAHCEVEMPLALNWVSLLLG